MNTHFKNVPGWFNAERLYAEQVEKARDGAVFAEIGTWMGRSTCYMGARIVASGKKIRLIAVDTFEGSPGHPEHRALGEIYPQFINNIKQAGCEQVITVMRMKSTEAANHVPGESLDFCYIDASHLYEDVKADIEAWLPKLRPGGLLAGDDFAASFPGVQRAVQEAFPKRFEVRDARCWTVTL